MHHLLTRQYLFNMPASLQRNHLRDIWHLERVHRLTLIGVQVADVHVYERERVVFDLKRFGRVLQVILDQTSEATTISVGKFQLMFKIHPVSEKQHWLEVSLFSEYRHLIWLLPFLEVAFAVTVLEDRLHYESLVARLATVAGRKAT